MVNGRQLTDKMLCSRGCRGLQASRLGLSSQVTLLGHLKGASQLVGLNIKRGAASCAASASSGANFAKKGSSLGNCGEHLRLSEYGGRPLPLIYLSICPLQPSIDVEEGLDAVRMKAASKTITLLQPGKLRRALAINIRPRFSPSWAE